MGFTDVDLDVGRPPNPEAWQTVRCLVDSGAVYSVIPSAILEALGIQPVQEEEFDLANGQKTTRKRGMAAFRFEGRIGGADVIFGEEGDANLLGAFTLEALGLALDPLRRELMPLRMMLTIQKRP
jgi:predicted aspartyl protease